MKHALLAPQDAAMRCSSLHFPSAPPKDVASMNQDDARVRRIKEWQRYFQTRQAIVGNVYKLRTLDVLTSKAIPAGLAFAGCVELVKGLRDLITGQNKKEGF